MLSVVGRIARLVQRAVCTVEPWGIILTSIAVVVTLTALMIELEDRQSQRIFQAWEIVLDASEMLTTLRPLPEQGGPDSDPSQNFQPPPVLGSGVRQALQFLNSKFEASGCFAIIEQISKYLAEGRGRACIFPEKKQESFEGVELPGDIDLSEVQLPNARLLGVNLEETNMTKAKLIEADLSNATLSEAKFIDADLTGANLTGANLNDADLAEADLTGADLVYSDINIANLNKVDLIGANLTGANLTDVNLIGADLTGADLTGANLTSANLTGAILTTEKLEFIDLREATLNDARLPDMHNKNLCVWHDAKGATKLWPEPTDDCDSRFLKFLTTQACQDNLMANVIVRRYVQLSESGEQVHSSILSQAEVAKALLATASDNCPSLDPHREELKQILTSGDHTVSEESKR